MGVPLWLIFLALGVNLFLLPYFLLLLVTTLAAYVSRPRVPRMDTPRSRFLIVVPAHNEEDGIAATVQSCLALDYPRDLFRVVVIADNCTDATAQVARREGADVVERHDESNRSKGYAIEYLIDRLQESGAFAGVDALIVIDADSIAYPGLLKGFADLLESGYDWVQCYYTVSNPEASWRTRLMTYAFCLFNGVSPLGQYSLGLSAGFRGNGMCLSTAGLRRIPWRSRGLVEDMEFSWAVRIQGEKIAFLKDQQVKGVMLGQGGPAAASQRRRWEFGRSDLKDLVFGPLLRSKKLNWIEKTTSLLELTMPSMVVLLSLYLCLLIVNVSTLLSMRPIQASAFSAFLIGASLIPTLALLLHALAPFLVFHLSWSYSSVLLYLPLYAAWKLLIRLGGRPGQWVRTSREQTANQKVRTAP
jgi:cellulose synthase/poly-beta-1,6-N-acetylglucosamine synthase-like glycosyltransferase